MKLVKDAQAEFEAAEAAAAEAKQRLAQACADAHDEGDMSYRAIGQVMGWSHVGVMKLCGRVDKDADE